MPKIFISYRRADSRKDAGRIYDRLVEAFGKENTFKDVDDIPDGEDFRGILSEAVNACDILLAVIGKDWLYIKDQHGNRRLDNPADFVRIEIQTALQRAGRCLVIPVLVDNAPPPGVDDLPLELRELAFKNARIVRDDPDFHNDVSRLIAGLQERYGAAPQSASVAMPAYNVQTAIARFYTLFDERKWEEARTVLIEIRASGKAPRVFNIDTHEKEIWSAIEVEERDREYDTLRMMAARSRPVGLWEALQKFWESFPNYDPDNLARFQPTPPPVGTPFLASATHKGADDDDDALYEEAVEMVRQLNKASVSLLMRRLRIGYSRAARLIDLMEKEGIIGPAVEGAKPREVLVYKKDLLTQPDSRFAKPREGLHDQNVIGTQLDSYFASLFKDWIADIQTSPPDVTTSSSVSAPSQQGMLRIDDKGVPMVYVPPGTLLMGSTRQQVEEAFAQAQKDHKDAKREWYEAELPQHEVVIATGFWLDLTPVTNEAYARFIQEGGYQERSFWTPGGWEWVQKNKKTGPQDYGNFGDPQQPRVGVTWFEAYAYCQWRGGRLPTEAEWEWAARGPENRIYPWGNTFDGEQVIYDKNSGGKTAAVGNGVRVAGASWVGALDMSGNVWEWCNTCYQPYPYRLDDGREGLDNSGNFRILRGGSWRNNSSPLFRAPYRDGDTPDLELNFFGSRCARSS